MTRVASVPLSPSKLTTTRATLQPPFLASGTEYPPVIVAWKQKQVCPQILCGDVACPSREWTIDNV